MAALGLSAFGGDDPSTVQDVQEPTDALQKSAEEAMPNAADQTDTGATDDAQDTAAAAAEAVTGEAAQSVREAMHGRPTEGGERQDQRK